MSQQPGNEPTLDIARGDAALSKHLHNSLSVLREKVDDPEFRKMVDDIKTGKTSLRDVAGSPVFARTLDPLAQQAAAKFENMTEDEREELARTGEAQFEELKNEDVAQSAARPGSAARGEEDDEDLSNRSWLE